MLERAIEQARLAYQFSPGSYTYHALRELLVMRDVLMAR